MSGMIFLACAVGRFMARSERAKRDELGQTLVEYGLVLALVSILAIVSITYFGDLIYNAYLAIAMYIGSL